AGLPVVRFDWKLAQGHQYCPTTIWTFSASREGAPEQRARPPRVSAKAPSGSSSQIPMLQSPPRKRARYGADNPSVLASSDAVAASNANLSGSPSFTAA